ncbi:MAG: sialidase family protein [Kiritimatiellae bacterium]|nr:sialidase family protein [Kiritimatiellia bacterium]MDD5522178.1 sialidase family protein [Kiritimatiellia bacterium]
MKHLINRRQMLWGTAAVVTTAMLGDSRRATAAPKATIREIKIISHDVKRYNGWPTIVRCRSGELLVSCSGSREGHVCPFGKVELMRSTDDGKTWSWPRMLMDAGIDNRDAGVLETAKGSILVTTFTSLAYESMLLKAEKIKTGEKGAWAVEKLQRWQAAHNRLTPEQRRESLGVWMLRSADGGRSWSAPYDALVSSPHGPIQLSAGRLIYAGVDLWRKPRRVGVCESIDDGCTWKWLADIPERTDDKSDQYHELHAVEAADGRLIVQIRNHNKNNSGETLQCESTDGGKTWSVPRSIGVWGLPSHLLRLKDNRLLMTYGYRRSPYGNQARLSEDNGRSWSEPMIISDDGAGGDLGYPSTVQLGDGSMLTVWYEFMAGIQGAVLRQARWSC